MAMDHSKASREKFRDLLLTITPNVYFRPPTNVRMKYPAIRYTLNRWEDQFANNKRYLTANEYLVTVIDRNEDSILVERMQSLANCRYDRQYVQDNLYHTVFVVKQ